MRYPPSPRATCSVRVMGGQSSQELFDGDIEKLRGLLPYNTAVRKLRVNKIIELTIEQAQELATALARIDLTVHRQSYPRTNDGAVFGSLSKVIRVFLDFLQKELTCIRE